VSPEPAATACSPQAWSFARLEELWEHFQPLTPYGKEAKEARRVLADREEIERAYDDTDAFAAFMAERSTFAAGSAADLDRLSYHLRRIPRLPTAALEAGARLELIDLFQVKKFIANYRAVVALLGDRMCARFGLRFHSAGLAAELETGGSDPETLFIASALHPELDGVRRAVSQEGAALHAERHAARERARRALGLDFGEREFLVVPNDRARALLTDRDAEVAVSVEAYDARSCVVRCKTARRSCSCWRSSIVCSLGNATWRPRCWRGCPGWPRRRPGTWQPTRGRSATWIWRAPARCWPPTWA